jgi:hypothetical protein
MHRAIIVINIFSIVVIDGFGPTVVAPVGKARPCGTCPDSEPWIIRIVDVVVVPPTIAVPITELCPVVFPIVLNVAEIFLSPILPLAIVSNSAGMVLYTIAGTSG